MVPRDPWGARWGLESAEAILKLRSLRSSGDFEVYWEFHKAQELARNHTSRYECLPVQKAACNGWIGHALPANTWRLRIKNPSSLSGGSNPLKLVIEAPIEGIGSRRLQRFHPSVDFLFGPTNTAG